MASSEYRPLQQYDSDAEKEHPGSSLKQPPHRLRVSYTWITVLLFASLVFNALSVYQQRNTRSTTLTAPTLYAGLQRDLAVPFTHDSVFTSKNRTIEDEAWKSPSLIPDTGLVALSDDWTRSKDLPEAQRWPWDESKGIYLLNGFHNMHCLHILRRSILAAYDGAPQALPREHVAHCLNILREVITCDADDTPRYTGRLNAQSSAEHPESGIGQVRMCRDWERLEAWAVEHSACYRAVGFGEKGFPPRERYKFCPGGERVWE